MAQGTTPLVLIRVVVRVRAYHWYVVSVFSVACGVSCLVSLLKVGLRSLKTKIASRRWKTEGPNVLIIHSDTRIHISDVKQCTTVSSPIRLLRYPTRNIN